MKGEGDHCGIAQLGSIFPTQDSHKTAGARYDKSIGRNIDHNRSNLEELVVEHDVPTDVGMHPN